MTDPRTCRHDVIEVIFGKNIDKSFTCASCGTERTEESLAGTIYDQDFETGLWVRNYNPKQKLYQEVE